MYRLAYHQLRRPWVSSSSTTRCTRRRSPATVLAYASGARVRDPNYIPYIYQPGTYAPDGDSRWMGSIAMDQMATWPWATASPLAPPSNPAIAAGSWTVLGIGTVEVTMHAGGVGSQTYPPGRWGDYSMMGT